MVDKRGRKVFPSELSNVKFKSVEEAEKWLEDNDERGTVVGDWKDK